MASTSFRQGVVDGPVKKGDFQTAARGAEGVPESGEAFQKVVAPPDGGSRGALVTKRMVSIPLFFK